MARTLPASLQTARRLLETGDAWLWLVEIESTTAGAYYRLTSGRRAVTFNNLDYQAGLASVEVAGEDIEASTAEARVVVPNVSLVPQAILDTEGDLLGQPVTLRLVHESAPTEVAALVWRYRVLRAETDPLRAVLVLGHAADLERVPSGTFTRAQFPTLVRGGGLLS